MAVFYIKIIFMDQFSRTQLLLGKQALEKLKNSKVAVFGAGGVGGYVIEALIRSGVGEIGIIDDDKVCLTNLNRQIFATRKTVGKYKVDVARDRILEINPDVKVNTYKMFYIPENSSDFDFLNYDYIVDAIDTVKAKISLIEKAKENNIPIICAMGAGNKIDATKFVVDDISKTSVCPLARVIRIELKKRKIKNVKVVYSKEPPIKPMEDAENSCNKNCICPPGARKCTVKHQIPGSIAYAPSIMGLIIAGEVIKDLTGCVN